VKLLGIGTVRYFFFALM